MRSLLWIPSRYIIQPFEPKANTYLAQSWSTESKPRILYQILMLHALSIVQMELNSLERPLAYLMSKLLGFVAGKPLLLMPSVHTSID